MFKNYFLVALRNFKRNKVFALINILGLSIGISASLVIFLIVQHEFSYEKSWTDKDRIYRVVTNMHFPDADFKNSGVPGPLPAAMIKEIPGVESSAYFWAGSDEYKVAVRSSSNKQTTFKKQKHIILASSDYFQLFHYRWLVGSVENSLSTPNKVVITESRAKDYFGSTPLTEAIGQVITYNDSIPATITGIVKDPEEVTDFTFKEFLSIATFAQQLKEHGGEDWGSVSSASQFFIKLQTGVDPIKIDKQLPALRKAHSKNAYLDTDHFLQPITDIHFNQDFDNFNQQLGHKPTLYGLLAVAAFLLLLGCINFINLTTAQATKRAKEIGIRKTMGSSKGKLVFQFLSETFLLTSAATIASIALTPAILKIFSDFVPDGLNINLSRQPGLLVFIPLLLVLVSLCSGLYPAMILSKYQPALVLKNIAQPNASTSRRAWVRKTLTVSQFVIAQFFIIATIIVGKQITFSLNKDLGFKKEAILNFTVPHNFERPDNKQFVLQQKLKSIPGIQGMSLAGAPPATTGIAIQTMKFKKDGREIETSVQVKHADTNYVGLYHIKLLAGRNLRQSDTAAEYIINEAYAKFLGYKNPQDIVGKQIDHGNFSLPIVGVVANLHTKSLHQAITPLAFTSQQEYHTTFHIALVPGNKDNEWKATIGQIGRAWKEVYPEDDFSYDFLDDSIAKFYKKEQDTARLLNWCTGLSVLISCLGLLGLVMYTTAQRTKEIGVRKVLGANVAQIVSLISKDFMQLVMLAFVITIPLAWMAMHNWLQNFAYRTTMSWWVFAVSGVLMFIVALLVLSIQIIRAANLNPVKSLRTE